jgi:hypothetical protein
MLALLAAVSLLADPVRCLPPSGTEALLSASPRFIVIGESHGTAEAPAAFAQMVCAAAERGPVTVALELPTTMQEELDAFLSAPDEAAALEVLADTPFLNPRMNDGRSSEAMLAMMHSVRAFRAQGRDVAFHAFQPVRTRPREMIQAWYELDMGHALAEAAFARPDARVLVLVGNLHARKTGHPRFEDVGLPAAGHLPHTETLTLNIAQQGGAAWNCQSECGVHTSRSTHDPELSGIILGPTDDGAFDGLLALGPSTASPPLRPEGEPIPQPTSGPEPSLVLTAAHLASARLEGREGFSDVR